MIRSLIYVLAAAAPVAAQQAPLTFETGKSFPLASGQWSYGPGVSGGEARFGSQLLLRCDRNSRTMTILRPGAPAGAATVVTDTLSRSLPPSGRILASDPLLDAMAFSRGRFLVSGGGAVLAVPSWPEAARAIEDCRN